MKTVYVDVLVAVNIFIDFMLLLCVRRCLNLRAGLGRLILGASVGGAASLAALLPSMPAPLNLTADMVFAAAVIFAAFGRASPAAFIKRTAVYFAFSFSFCGVMMFLLTLLRPRGIEIYNDVVYFNINPVLLVLLTLVCYGAARLFRRLRGSGAARRVCRVLIVCDSGIAELDALVDTGCEVKEPFSGDPVIVAEAECFAFDPFGDRGFRVIPFNSLGGGGFLKGFRPNAVSIDGAPVGNGLYVGVCSGALLGEVKAVVPAALINNE